jgi:iron-sulfur cluster repair protein YtfE (RIC family)
VIRIGSRRGQGGDAVDALLDCHARIREMTALARALAGAHGRTEAEVAEAAARVRRYFTESLAHHVEDEEQSLLPRLRGRDPAVDAALDQMAAEHAAHESLVASLVAVCAALESRPAALSEKRAELDPVSAQLASELAVHLAGEEQIIFPAVRRLLSTDERDQVRAEMRARRGGERDG